MIGLSDIPKFLLAFFLVLPVISVLHETGHVFFAWLMGGKNIRVSIGSGKPVFQLGILEFRKYYFWYGMCTFENIKKKDRFSNGLIFMGGSLFNILGALAVILLVENETLEPNIFTYQFTYFSLYYIFFALFPMAYPDGNYSDGKIIMDLVKGKEKAIMLRTYRVQWHKGDGQWHVFDHSGRRVQSTEQEKEAMAKAKELAQANRPSRIIHISEDSEREVQNYPRIPM